MSHEPPDPFMDDLREQIYNLNFELTEAKRLLRLAKDKLRFPGYYNVVADEIERFLNK